MNGNGNLKLNGLRRIIGAFMCVMAAALVSAGSASANSDSAVRSTQAQNAGIVNQRSADTANPSAVPRATIDGCPFEWFCAYPDANFGGTPIKMFNCGVDVFIPFVGNGSWINNQTSGTVARFKDANHHVIGVTPGTFSASTSENWTPVFYVQAC